LLLGPMMYQHIFGRHAAFAGATGDSRAAGKSFLGIAKAAEKLQAAKQEAAQSQISAELGSRVAEAFCRAFEIRV